MVLILRLIGGEYEQRVTPHLCYDAEKDGKSVEYDLSCLYKPSIWREADTYVLHAECKSRNQFELKDIERMKELAITFPGAALVFATLNSDLTESEVKIIRDLAVAEREKELLGKLSSPVIILTGTELFSHRIAEIWKDKGGIFEQWSHRSYKLKQLHTLAEATQQLYLKIPAWGEWIKKKKSSIRNLS